MRGSRFLRFHFFNKALLRNNGIARRMMVAVIVFSSVVTGVTTGVELYLGYREDISDIGDRIESIRKVYLPTLTESVWVAERTQIENQLNGLLNLGDIEYLGIVADGQVQWSAGARASELHMDRSFALERMHRGQNVTIAELQVVASVDNVVRRLWDRLWVMLVSNGIKTFLVTTFVLLIFQAMVGQHLEHISGYLRRFSKDVSHSQDLTLHRPATGLWRPDALDHVTAATNAMRNDVARAQIDSTVARQRLEAIIDTSPLAIYTRDLNDRVTSWNAAAERMFGWTAAEAIGHPLHSVSPTKRGEADGLSSRVRHGESIVQLELVRQRRDGSPIDISLSIAPLRDPTGLLYGYTSIVADITERKATEKQIEFLAYHDVLTGLPNRLLLRDRFEQARAHATRAGTKLAMLFLDVDNFKNINDTLGHDAGDTLLRQISARLTECVRDTDTVSRQGGDEFMMLLSDLADVDDTAPILAKVIGCLEQPFDASGKELSTSVSVGVAVFPDDGTTFDMLMKKADMAMYQAKDAGRNTYRFFDEAINVEALDHLMIRNGLRRALDSAEFVLYYQPKVDLSSAAVTGVEALIRWNHPEMGLVSPARFIPVAEDSGLIVPIGEWVLREACRQAMAWRHAGLPELSMAVNLSAVQFRRGNVEQSVALALAETGFKPELLELELTESILLVDMDAVLGSVKRLKQLGVKLSLDDFGTGYSSLSYLKRFDIDKLKIDQSFVRDLATDPDDAAIVRAIIQMARSLNVRTIAEGVETAEILEQLRSFQCDEAQGYHFARPMPAPEFAAYLTGTLG
jgi:diguanylate cyclase (GGDEF)-like protein/PAS domain S-box-containing protein